MKEIKIEIDQDGNVTLEINGVQGKLCLAETKKLEEELGLVEKRDKKPSFYAKVDNKQKVGNRR